jgi:voltage-gated potassium channel
MMVDEAPDEDEVAVIVTPEELESLEVELLKLEVPEEEEEEVIPAKGLRRDRKPPPKINWSKIKRTAPDLYVVSLIILIFGLVLIASVPVSFFLGTQLPLVPTEMLALGGTLTFLAGIALVILGYRLVRRERVAWAWTMFILAIALGAGVIQGTITSTATALVIVLLMLYLFFRRGLFTRVTGTIFGPRETIAITTLIFVILYGMFGSLYLSDRGEFEPPMEDYTDALYFTIDTITTLGHANYQANSTTAKWFTIGLMLMGVTAFLGSIGVLLLPYIERRFKGVVGVLQKIQETPMRDHIIVCGHSDETDLLIDFLKESGEAFVVVSRERDYVDRLREEGVNVVSGDPATEDPLIKAHVENARSLVAIHEDDAENAFIIVTAREIRKDLFIIAMARLRENVPKLKKVGANSVVAPHVIVTRYIGRTALAGQVDTGPEC